MQVMQNRMISISGLTREEANAKYAIMDVADFLNSSCIAQVVLNTPDHCLPTSLLSTRRKSSPFPYVIPIARSEPAV